MYTVSLHRKMGRRLEEVLYGGADSMVNKHKWPINAEKYVLLP